MGRLPGASGHQLKADIASGPLNWRVVSADSFAFVIAKQPARWCVGLQGRLRPPGSFRVGAI